MGVTGLAELQSSRLTACDLMKADLENIDGKVEPISWVARPSTVAIFPVADVVQAPFLLYTDLAITHLLCVVVPLLSCKANGPTGVDVLLSHKLQHEVHMRSVLHLSRGPCQGFTCHAAVKTTSRRLCSLEPFCEKFCSQPAFVARKFRSSSSASEESGLIMSLSGHHSA